MKDTEIQFLKSSIDKAIQIKTCDGEQLVGRVIAVFSDSECDKHELLYVLLSTNMPAS